MALTPGTRLGPYEITAQIGVGGMGEVYRARDTKLDRDVAIKVLPASLAGDPDRIARFQREAKTLASLNHPNIAAIYGLEEADRTKALVMELVEGPTLADRIARGPIPVDEALPIAKQIAEALEAAHEQGIDSPRLEAREHQAAAGWGRQGAGLRSGEGAGADGGDVAWVLAVADDHDPGDDTGGDDPRDGGLHESRAGQRAHGGQAQ